MSSLLIQKREFLGLFHAIKINNFIVIPYTVKYMFSYGNFIVETCMYNFIVGLGNVWNGFQYTPV